MTWDIKAPVYQPHASQFYNGLRGSCTLLALAACDIVAKGIRAWVGNPHVEHPDPASAENVQAVMYRLYVQARQYGLCAANGAMNQAGVIKLAKIIGLPIKEVLYYAEPLPAENWVYFLRRHIAHSDTPYPMLCQVANGAALVDCATRDRDEAGLQYHAIALYGCQTDASDQTAGGYIGADGDQPDADRLPACYNLETLNNARPVSMIAFDYVR